jgi:protocatechuate 3,4-dioxygenase beta subunit
VVIFGFLVFFCYITASITDEVNVKNIKSLLVYIVGIVGLAVASVSFSLPGETVDAGNPAATLTARAPSPTPAPTATVVPGCESTPATGRQGYRSGAPLTTGLTPPPVFSRLNQRLTISGRLFAGDCSTPLPEALIEVWHADPEGRYDQSDQFYLRGKFYTDAAGRYKFSTVAPGHYQRGSTWQPVHIHFRVSHPNYEPFYTQLYFSDDPYLGELPPAAQPLIGTLTEMTGANGIAWKTQFNITLPPSP